MRMKVVELKVGMKVGIEDEDGREGEYEDVEDNHIIMMI